MWHRDLPTGTIDLTVAHPGGVAKLLAGHDTRLSELVRESVALTEARRRVSAIRTKAAELLREHGMSTLFLAVGMASWHLPRAPIPPRAPVLLRGAQIRPTDASRRDFVLHLDSDVVFNPALEHYLRGERGLELEGSVLAGASIGRHGFDPRPTYDRLELICHDIEGFGIGPQLVLSTYPLAKLPLVAELTGPVERLAERPLLVGLARAEASQPGHSPGPGPHTPDSATAAPPASASDPRQSRASVVETDEAQRAVLDLLARGESVVLDAVPGTGRTQTISNAVADSIRTGGATVVAAEQRRALRDVRERLTSVGLGDLVLEIQETPAGARQAAAELMAALDRHLANRDQTDQQQTVTPERSDSDPVEVLRAHEQHLHGRREPWGVSLAQTQDVLTRLAALPQPPTSHVRLDQQVLAELTPESLQDVHGALERAVAAGAWKSRSEDPWFGARITNDHEAERAAGIVSDLVSGRFTEAREQVGDLAAAAGLPVPVNLQQWSRTFDLFHRVRDTLDIFTPEVYEAPLEELVRAARRPTRGSTEKVPAVSRGRLRRQARGLLRPGTPPSDLGERLVHALQERQEWESLAGRAARPNTPRGWEEAAAEYAEIHGELSWLGEVLAGTSYGRDLETTHLDLLLERLVRLDARADRVPVVAAVHADLQPLRDRGLGRLVDDLARRGVQQEHVAAEAQLVFWASVHDHLARAGAGSTSADLRQALADLEAREQAQAAAAAASVRSAARAQVEAVMAAHPEQIEALRGRHEAGPPWRLLDLITESPDLVQALKPCWLVSPLTIPATLPSDLQIDLVAFDEAQRIPVSHAVPALSRAAQVLVVGDSAGLPALPFTGVADEPAKTVEPVGISVHAAASRLLPVLELDTHYRTLDQRMVPVRSGRAVQGYPGVLRQSRVAAVDISDPDELVDKVVRTVLDHARRSPRHSLAVLVDTPQVAHQIETALWAQVADEADLLGSFREDVTEPFLVTTVERAAGEVRDRVLLVLTGRSELSAAWAVAALDTARRSVMVVADHPPRQRTGAAGDVIRAAILRAQTDPTELDAAGEPPALVDDLAARLRAEHLTVRQGFGSGRHRIELVVDDPAEPGRPLLAIDTDARPRSAASDPGQLGARARQLRRLGWTPVRVWTTDVFRDPAREVARIVEVARQASQRRRR